MANIKNFKLSLEDQPANEILNQWQKYQKFVDPSGRLNFQGKAILDANGVEFKEGKNYKINLTELIIGEEIGRGQYGVVNKVCHSPTSVIMAMKQIRLEITDEVFNQILMELEVLHRSHSPYIVEFYGAFFIESCVYYCMEYMDAGSLDKLYGTGIRNEPILSFISQSIVLGLNFLKEELSVIHRDVKPTNVLWNQQGQVKLCDFGVSGQLISSLAKTNIGCQSYMAPERIAVFDSAPYSVSSDIWSLGLTLWETAMGHYPFPIKNYDSVFAQLNAIVNETPPDLPDVFSKECREFIKRCLNKDPRKRPNYKELMQDEFILKHQTTVEQRQAWKSRWFWPLTGTVTLLLGLSLYYYNTLQNKKDDEEEINKKEELKHGPIEVLISKTFQNHPSFYLELTQEIHQYHANGLILILPLGKEQLEHVKKDQIPIADENILYCGSMEALKAMVSQLKPKSFIPCI